ncbi:MAG: fatty acid hydroxylase [Pedosphaera sp.]|nr:fatty acid hydroxylase [Pedosphaera sp.]
MTLDIWFWISAGFGLGIVYSSFFEWTLHRFVMHKAVGSFDYAFKAHAVVHHQTFKADHTYHVVNDKDKHLIPMAWWNGPVLVTLTQAPFILASWQTGHWALLLGSSISCAAYYCAYEYIHWCMHLPKTRNIERSGIYFRLNGHHLLHHRYMHKNFNVVLPLADLCLGTLLLRSKVRFAQPMGAAVPNVQPNARLRDPIPEPLELDEVAVGK